MNGHGTLPMVEAARNWCGPQSVRFMIGGGPLRPLIVEMNDAMRC